MELIGMTINNKQTKIVCNFILFLIMIFLPFLDYGQGKERIEFGSFEKANKYSDSVIIFNYRCGIDSLINGENDLRNFKNLEYLIIYCNENNVPDELFLNKSVKIIEFRGAFSSLPSKLYDLPNLEWLIFESNGLDTIPVYFNLLLNLKKLTFVNNKLKKFPLELCNQKNIEVIDFSQNKINEIPSELEKLTNLKSLSLSQNRLSFFPIEICQLISLKELYLTSNNIKEIPIEIKNLKQLEKLYIDNNQKIKNIDPLISLESLKELFIVGNSIKHRQVKNMRKLRPDCNVLFE